MTKNFAYWLRCWQWHWKNWNAFFSFGHSCIKNPYSQKLWKYFIGIGKFWDEISYVRNWAIEPPLAIKIVEIQKLVFRTLVVIALSIANFVSILRTKSEKRTWRFAVFCCCLDAMNQSLTPEREPFTLRMFVLFFALKYEQKTYLFYRIWIKTQMCKFCQYKRATLQNNIYWQIWKILLDLRNFEKFHFSKLIN